MGPPASELWTEEQKSMLDRSKKKLLKKIFKQMHPHCPLDLFPTGADIADMEVVRFVGHWACRLGNCAKNWFKGHQ